MFGFKRHLTTAAALIALLPAIARAEEKSIAFMRAGPDPYYQYGMDAALVAAKELGVNLSTYSANNDSSQELANVQDAITKGVKGILDLRRFALIGKSGDRSGQQGRRSYFLPVRL